MPNMMFWFRRYLEVGTVFSEKYRFLDSAIYTLFQHVENGVAQRKEYIYWTKRLFFPVYVFYKYFSLRPLRFRDEMPRCPNIEVLAIIHGSGPQHFGDLAKLVEELIKHEQRVLVVYGTISSDQKEHLTSLKNVYLLDQGMAAFNVGVREFLANIFKSARMVKELLIITGKDKDLAGVLNRYRGFLLDQFFVSICYFNYSERILENYNIRIAFSSNEGSNFAMGYFLNANSKGIQNFVLQHGFADILQCKYVADRVVTWLRLDQDYYVRNGFSRERLLPLGLPRFDSIRTENVETQNRFQNPSNVQGPQPKVCFAFALHAYNIYSDYYKAYLEEINSISLLLIQRNVRVFLRAHPSDDIDEYKRFLSREVASSITIPSTSFPLVQLLKQMDVYVADFSTSLIEAMICNVPTVTVNFDNYWDKNDVAVNYRAIGASYIVTKKNGTLSAIEEILFNETCRNNLLRKQARFVEDNIINLGCATQKITEYILHQCHKDSKH